MLILPSHLVHRKTKARSLTIRLPFKMDPLPNLFLIECSFCSKRLSISVDEDLRISLGHLGGCHRGTHHGARTGDLWPRHFSVFPRGGGRSSLRNPLMPEGINVELTEQGARQIENAVTLLKAEIAKDLNRPASGGPVRNVFSSIGANAARSSGPQAEQQAART